MSEDGFGPPRGCFEHRGIRRECAGFPFTATNAETHANLMAGMYGVRLSVRDDNGGARNNMVIIVID